MRLQFKKCNLVLLLLCLINFLNIFVPRKAEEASGDYSVRLPIHILYMTILAFMVYNILGFSNKNSRHIFKPFERSINILVSLIIIYFIIGFLAPSFQEMGYPQYIRFATWLVAIIFFSRFALEADGLTVKLAQIYVLLFLVVAAKKMIETRIVIGEKTFAQGDTLGLTLVILIPVIFMFFKGNMKIIITVLTAGLILLSIRRTAIIALAICFPFIFNEIRSKLKTAHIIMFTCFIAIALIYAWDFVGQELYYRFDSLLIGDKGGERDSFGSGRSDFYMVTYNGWAKSSPFSLLFGHGIGAVRNLLRLEYSDIGHTHNDFLEILYTFGLIGTLIWLNFLFQLCLVINRKIKQFAPSKLRLHKITIISFLIISLSSGTLFRVEMINLALSTGFILSEVMQRRKVKNALDSNTKSMNVLNSF